MQKNTRRTFWPKFLRIAMTYSAAAPSQVSPRRTARSGAPSPETAQRIAGPPAARGHYARAEADVATWRSLPAGSLGPRRNQRRGPAGNAGGRTAPVGAHRQRQLAPPTERDRLKIGARANPSADFTGYVNKGQEEAGPQATPLRCHLPRVLRLLFLAVAAGLLAYLAVTCFGAEGPWFRLCQCTSF
jgi:hypothetical protein